MLWANFLKNFQKKYIFFSTNAQCDSLRLFKIRKIKNITSILNDNENSFNDELLNKAIEIIIVSKQASISLLQRRLSIGYSRAARLIDEMERLRIVGPFSGSKAREILVDESYLETIRDDEEI